MQLGATGGSDLTWIALAASLHGNLYVQIYNAAGYPQMVEHFKSKGPHYELPIRWLRYQVRHVPTCKGHHFPCPMASVGLVGLEVQRSGVHARPG